MGGWVNTWTGGPVGWRVPTYSKSPPGTKVGPSSPPLHDNLLACAGGTHASLCLLADKDAFPAACLPLDLVVRETADGTLPPQALPAFKSSIEKAVELSGLFRLDFLRAILGVEITLFNFLS